MAVPAIHPGEHLTEELKDLNMGAAALARRAQGAHEPHRRDSQRPAGRRRRYRSAPRVLLGTIAEFWLNLQKLYELRPAEKRAGKMIKALPTLTKRTRPRLSVAGARNGPSPSRAPRMPMPADRVRALSPPGRRKRAPSPLGSTNSAPLRNGAATHLQKKRALWLQSVMTSAARSR